MRATILGVCAACVLLITPSYAAVIAPTNADEASLMQIEGLGDRSADIWQGRHHYLYDDQYQPNSESVGSAPSDARACDREPVRLRRSDGKTVVRRLSRCE